MKYLVNLDMSKNEIQNAVLQNLASAPVNPKEGQFYFNTADSTMYVYAGGKWIDALFVYTLTAAAIKAALGFAPTNIKFGADSSKGSATGSKAVYIATDTKKIYLDNASGSWLQVGGQDSIAWGKVTGKPSTFTPPVASGSQLGGIKVGDNLKIESDGTLSAVYGGSDGTNVYLIKQQVYTATAGQRDFTITNGEYRTGAGLLSVFLNGVKLSATAITETGNTSFRLPSGLSAGDIVLAEYVQIMDAEVYLSHAAEHLPGGADAIPYATEEIGGLISPQLVIKLNAIAEGANKTVVDSALSSTSTNPVQNKLIYSALAGKVPTTRKVNGKALSGDISLSAADVGADASGTASSAVSGHNSSATAHSDIRKLIQDVKDELGAFLDIDDTTMDQATEFVAYMKANRSLIESVTTSKANAADLKAHTDNTSNPHKVTKSQVGLGNVENVSVNNHAPTYTDVTSLTTLVSGEKFTAAFPKIKLAITTLINHLDNKNNPHEVDKSDVGLGNVPNVATNNQTPTYSAASTLATLVSGEKLSVSMGKIMKAISDLITHLADTTKHITSSERTSWNSRTKKYAANIGNGSATEITVTHSLGTQDVTVLVRETASPYNQVFCDVKVVSTTQIKLLFATAPASGAYRVVVTG